MNFNSIRQLIDSCKPKREERRILSPMLSRPCLPRPEPPKSMVNVVPYNTTLGLIESIELRNSEVILKVGDIIKARTLNNPVTINSFQYDNDVLTFTYTDSLGNICCNSVESHSPWIQYLGEPEKLKQIEYNFIDLADNNIDYKVYCSRKRSRFTQNLGSYPQTTFIDGSSIYYNIIIENIIVNTTDTLNIILSGNDRMIATDFKTDDYHNRIILSEGKLTVSFWYYE